MSSTHAVQVLILQHPQEPDQELNSVRLLLKHLPEARVRVGLSWSNLSKAWSGKNADEPKPEPKRWGTLFLGSQTMLKENHGLEPGLYAVARDKSLRLIAPGSLDGVIALDGTWSQGKTLWWRNAWLLKTKRLVLIPPARSFYGKRRKEPRPECVSTLESIAYTLGALQSHGDKPVEMIEDFKAWVAQLPPSSKK